MLTPAEMLRIGELAATIEHEPLNFGTYSDLLKALTLIEKAAAEAHQIIAVALAHNKLTPHILQ